MAFHKCLASRVFRFEATIHPGRIKISESLRKEFIDHPACLFQIDACRIIRICKGQAHQAKAKFFS